VTNRRFGLPSDTALRRRVERLRTTGPWAHDVVDLARRNVVTDVAKTPLTAAARSQRLARLGHIFDGSIFGGPTYRLSSQKPYQESPLAWSHFSGDLSYVTEVEFISWGQPRDPGTDRGFAHFHFEEPPAGKCMATLSISTFPHSGTTGAITIRADGADVSIPVTRSINRIVEVVFEPTASGPADVVMILEPGIQVLAFFFMTLGPAPLVFTPD
jgi:hypothetical protein